MLIEKAVVLETNKSDSNYISMNENKFKELEEYLKNNDIELSINYFTTNQDKKIKNILTTTNIKIKRLEKMGVRSYNKKDSSKNTYRIKYFT